MANKKRVLLLGANGFIGRHVHEVFRGSFDVLATGRGVEEALVEVDLLNKVQIIKIVENFQPEIIINCAGVVDNSEKARLNVEFTKNLLEAIQISGLKPKVILCGSASAYGVIAEGLSLVSESHPQTPVGKYAEAKKLEEDLALKFSIENKINIVVIRIFNPIGAGMKGRFLITSLLSQIQDLSEGKIKKITINRLDSLRDFLDVRDLAIAIKQIATKPNHHQIYNVGSGIATSVEDLIDLLLKAKKITNKVAIDQKSSEPEDVFANRADISRIKDDIGWQPKYNLEDTIKEIVSAKN